MPLTLWPIVCVTGSLNALAWAHYVATVNPTIGGALIGILGTLSGVALNAWLISRHETRMTAELQRRRVVVAKLDDGFMLTDEERRALEDIHGNLGRREGDAT